MDDDQTMRLFGLDINISVEELPEVVIGNFHLQSAITQLLDIYGPLFLLRTRNTAMTDINFTLMNALTQTPLNAAQTKTLHGLLTRARENLKKD